MLHDSDIVGREECMIREMRTHDHSDTGICKLVDDLKNPYLVAEIKVRCRFIKQKYCRFLGQGTGNHGKLVFASTDLIHRFIRDLPDTDEIQFLVSFCIITFSGRGECSEMGSPPHQDKIPYGKREDDLMCLRDIPDLFGNFNMLHTRQIFTKEPDRAGAESVQ